MGEESENSAPKGSPLGGGVPGSSAPQALPFRTVLSGLAPSTGRGQAGPGGLGEAGGGGGGGGGRPGGGPGGAGGLGDAREERRGERMTPSRHSWAAPEPGPDLGHEPPTP